jgi:hypothetical protein
MINTIPAELTEELFIELEPALAGIAAKLGTADPAGEARSWYARFSEIIQAFNSGRLHGEIHRDDGTIEQLSDHPTKEQVAAFKKSLKAYLKTSFKNDLRQAYKIRSRHASLSSDLEQSSIEKTLHHDHNLSEEEVIRLSDLVLLIKRDVERQRRTATAARDHANLLFLVAMLDFHMQLIADYGDMPIVRDLSACDPREFFVYDIREGRTAAISKRLKELLESEPAKAVHLCSKKLLSPDKGYFTLNRKISRYFNDNLGGMPLRLKKIRLELSSSK